MAGHRKIVAIRSDFGQIMINDQRQTSNKLFRREREATDNNTTVLYTV